MFEAKEKDGPILFSFPHDGSEIPETLRQRFTDTGLQSIDTDWCIADLYSFINETPHSYIKARYSRYVVDLNRPADGEALYPGKSETSLCPSESFDGRPLYKDHPPDTSEVNHRINTYWSPYHYHLQKELKRIKSRHGFAILWDAHSIRGQVPKFFDGTLPELNFGTANGASCDSSLESKVMAVATSSRYSCVLNGRFKGGFITRHYGDPDNNIFAIQLEINQQAYLETEWPPVMSETKAHRLRKTLRSLIQTCASVVC